MTDNISFSDIVVALNPRGAQNDELTNSPWAQESPVDKGSKSLREAAQNLTIYARYKASSSEGRRELLDLLRSGSLSACFRFPSLKRPQIAIPTAHWAKTRVGLFQKRMNVTGRNSGDYVVIPYQFRMLYISWFGQNCKLPDDAEELSRALTSVQDGVEVYIPDDEWNRFITEEGLGSTEHSNEYLKSSRGKSENTNWLAIMTEVAVELLNAKAANDVRPVATHVAQAVHSRVTPRERSSLPKVDTITEQVRNIINQHWN